MKVNIFFCSTNMIFNIVKRTVQIHSEMHTRLSSCKISSKHNSLTGQHFPRERFQFYNLFLLCILSFLNGRNWIIILLRHIWADFFVIIKTSPVNGNKINHQYLPSKLQAVLKQRNIYFFQPWKTEGKLRGATGFNDNLDVIEFYMFNS